MFEEIEARAYKNLRTELKSLFRDMIEKMRLENVQVREYADMKRFADAEYHSGYHDAVSDTLDRIMNILDTINKDVFEQMSAEDDKVLKYYESEPSDDDSRHEQQ